MPLYEYECRKCRRRTERIEKVAGPHVKKCPHCGGAVERLLAAPAVQFKGAGWYATDYAAKRAPAESEKAEKPAAEGTASAEAKPAESSAKDKEKKPAKKK